MQRTVLGPNMQAPLRVYAVWFNMYPGDAREHWRDTLLTDPRVRHYWDQEGVLGRLYLQNVSRVWPARAAGTAVPQDDALWDAYLLYGPRARWKDQPPDVISWGATILQTMDTLQHDVQRSLKR